MTTWSFTRPDDWSQYAPPSGYKFLMTCTYVGVDRLARMITCSYLPVHNLDNNKYICVLRVHTKYVNAVNLGRTEHFSVLSILHHLYTTHDNVAFPFYPADMWPCALAALLQTGHFRSSDFFMPATSFTPWQHLRITPRLSEQRQSMIKPYVSHIPS